MKVLKRLSAFLAALALLGAAELSAYDISITQFVKHPSLDQSVKGFQDAILEGNLTEVKYTLHLAAARTDQAAQVVSTMMGDKPDLILAVSTLSAMPAVNAIKDIPILFTAVTDPVAAKLVNSLESPGGNVTGTTDMNPVGSQIELIKEVQPDIKRLGIIFNSGEVNSLVQLDLAKAKCQELGIELVESPTVNTAGVSAAADKLAGEKVEAIYLPTDNTVISSLEAILKVALDQKIPIYPAEDDSIRKGGVAVLSINYYQLGKLTGRMAVRILKDGEKPASIPVGSITDYKLVVNTGYADKIGLTIPDSVLSKADETVK